MTRSKYPRSKYLRWITAFALGLAMVVCFLPYRADAASQTINAGQTVNAGQMNRDQALAEDRADADGQMDPGSREDVDQALAEDRTDVPTVDGEEVFSTSDPLDVADHIDDHWQTGQYYEDGSPYQLQRIIVRTDGCIDDSRGAEDAIHYQTSDQVSDEYILEYGSRTETKKAYDALADEYGEDRVLLDTLISIDSISIKQSSQNNVCWGTHLTGLDDLKELSLEEHKRMGLDHGVTVAILDTGINAGHEMFRNRLIHKDSKSFISSASALKDDHGHGSHVAGIIADATCPHAEFLILKVMDKNGQGGLYNVTKAIDYAVDHGARIINMSIGVDGIEPGSPSHELMEAALKRAKDKEVVTVTAAGNGHGTGKDILKAQSYPAYSPYTIAVGAIDKELHRAGFSYYGKALDFSAPGKSIRSAWKGGSGSYKTTSGTSMATPEITAAAAMVEIYHPGYTADEIYEVLVEHSVDLGSRGKDKYYGYGYVKMPTPESTAIIGGFDIGLNSNPAGVPSVKIKSLRKGKGSFRAAWTKGNHINGYQIQYATVKTMADGKKKTISKSNQTKCTINKLKSGKTYYVQVRCYTKEDGITHYGEWSSVKKVRTK